MSHLCHLTHMGLLIDVDASLDMADDVALINTVIQRAASVSATLRYFRLGDRRHMLDWMVVERNEDGSYKGWHFPEHQEGVSESYWGDFFIGAPRRAILGF
jgi:hypothetical protein